MISRQRLQVRKWMSLQLRGCRSTLEQLVYFLSSCSQRYMQVEEQDLSDDFGREILVQLSWVVVTELKVAFRLCKGLSPLPG